jgi:hypothetical protein
VVLLRLLVSLEPGVSVGFRAGSRFQAVDRRVRNPVRLKMCELTGWSVGEAAECAVDPGEQLSQCVRRNRVPNGRCYDDLVINGHFPF